ncbi:MAG: protein of unknown function UPF0052 and CofD [uncultured bacterium]|nr:MAG: protein of unknown function UPF0052 and CofD [uncultured bacterium]
MKKNIVAIGGGTGLATLLKGLKDYGLNISAIVTMTDDGMSSGRLRKTFNVLPPGDIRKTIVALAEKEDLVKSLFEYRFRRGKGLAGHSLGNLLIIALEKITGSFSQAIASASEILKTKGKVIPSTYNNANIISTHKSGKIIKGERKAFNRGLVDPIISIKLDNNSIKANPEAIDAIKNAHVILIGPGSLWTSIIPNLLIQEITQAVVNNKLAQKIYICNVSTERGETQGYSVTNHVETLIKHSHKNIINFVLVNNKAKRTTKKFAKLGEVHNIITDLDRINSYKIINKNIISEQNPLFHDSKKLAKVIWEIINE